MSSKITIVSIISAILIIGAGINLASFINRLEAENTRLKENQEILLSQREILAEENQLFKVTDSLNAIRVSQLNFTLKEYKAYRQEDLKTIEQLVSKGSDLQKVVTSQLESINKLSLALQDSIRIVDGVIDTLKTFSYKSKWNDIEGVLNLRTDSLSSLQIINKEDLKIVEECKYKRFLGFLWKTNKVKARKVSVISMNPKTKIKKCEFIAIVH